VVVKLSNPSLCNPPGKQQHLDVDFSTWGGSTKRNKSRLTESQIFQRLKEAEAGIPVTDLCRKHGMSNATFYQCRAQFGGMDAPAMKRLKELKEENARLQMGGLQNHSSLVA
jgi:putative transposase